MTHAELVDRAVAWLRGTLRCKHAFAEPCGWGVAELADAIGWHENGRSVVVEVKASRSDFRRDAKKPHMLGPASGMGARRFYLAPAGVIPSLALPSWCGLIEIAPTSRLEVIVEAPDRAQYDHAAEAKILTKAIRRYQLGVRFDAKRGRFETVPEAEARKQREARERREAKRAETDEVAS